MDNKTKIHSSTYLEEPAIGATGANAKRDLAATSGAMPFVSRFLFVDVNPRVDAATIELHADIAAADAFLFGFASISAR
jgi:hypothetical protein